MQDFSSEDKTREDSHLWTTWLKKYAKRVYDESEKIENFDKERKHLMNSSNPRFYHLFRF